MTLISDKEKIYVNKFIENICPKHEHDFLELVYVLHGSAKQVINNKEITIHKGNYFIIDYNTYHSYKKISNEKFCIMNCLFTPDFIDQTLKHCRKFSEVTENYLIHYSYSSINVNPANRVFSDHDGSIYSLIMKLYGEYIEKTVGYIEIMRCTLIEIIIHTMRILQSENEPVYSSTEKYIVDFVRDNYMKKITLTEIANNLNYSTPYLSKIFHKNYGMTFEHFLQKTRIEQSCRLLANTDKKIIDIALSTGYTDLKFFNSVFKKFMNTTPGKYRKLYR